MKRTTMAAILATTASLGAFAAGPTFTLGAFCQIDPGVPNPPGVYPTPDDRAFFDRVLVSYVAGSQSTPGEAASLALNLMAKRSDKFYVHRPIPPAPALGPKMTPEEVATWSALMTAAMNDGATGYRSAVATTGGAIINRAFGAAWEAMMQRREFVLLDCDTTDDGNPDSNQLARR